MQQLFLQIGIFIKTVDYFLIIDTPCNCVALAGIASRVLSSYQASTECESVRQEGADWPVGSTAEASGSRVADVKL